VLLLAVPFPAYLAVHINTVHCGSGFNERPIEKVSVVSCNYGWPRFLDVEKKPLNNRFLFGLVEYNERTLVLRFWGVLEVSYVLGYDCPISNEKALPVNHV